MFPLRGAWFWLIDDTEHLGSIAIFRQNSSFWDAFLERIKLTELSDLNNSISRFRPVYYLLRILQAGLFGMDPNPYFFFNALLLAGGLFALGMAARRFFSWPLVFALLLATLSLGFNRDLWCRLGPSEREAFCFSMLFICAVAYQKKPWAWPLACISAALAIGAKENFLCLLLPLAFLATGVRKKRSLLWLLIPAAMAIPVGYVMFRALFLVRHDTYFATLDLHAFLTPFLHIRVAAFVVCIFCLAGIILAPKFYRKDANVSPEIHKQSVCWAVIIIILMFFNIIFYRQHLGWSIRYGFPFYFLALPLVLILAYNIKYCMTKKHYALLTAVCTILTCIVCFPSMIKLYENNKSQAVRTRSVKMVFEKAKEYRGILLINPRQMLESFEPFPALISFRDAGMSEGFEGVVRYYPLFQTPENQFYFQLESLFKKGRASTDFSKDVTQGIYALSGFDFKGNLFIFDPGIKEYAIDKIFIDQKLQGTRGNYYRLDRPITIYAPRQYKNSRLTSITLHGKFKNPEGVEVSVDDIKLAHGALRKTDAAIAIRIPPESIQDTKENPLLQLGVYPPKTPDSAPEVATVEFNYEAGGN
ncbi:hypothetical protein [uncultured Desulfovibrio sp.]|uniref:hypothetical protein n=1 Tax=uncultured Desulfovibrio sp. TaxID=167968 RepID=UPI002805D213|nr:hypothetical protein [uncultured Desulfovibrio sp.]